MTEKNVAYDLSADRVFRGMAIAEHPDVPRHFLTGLFIEPIEDGGAWIVASDGHIMLVQRDRQATVKEAAILKFQAPRCNYPIEYDEGFIERDWCWGKSRISVAELAPSQTVAAPVASNGGDPWLNVLVEKIEGKFPDWRKPLGQDGRLKKSKYKNKMNGISAALLSRLCGPHHGMCGVQIHGSFSDLKPLLVTFGEDEDSFGAIMKRTLSLSSSPLNDLLTSIGRDDLAGASGREAEECSAS